MYETFSLRKAQKEKEDTFLISGINGHQIKMNRAVKTLPTTNIDGLRLTQAIRSPIYSTDSGRRGGWVEQKEAARRNVDGVMDVSGAGRR